MGTPPGLPPHPILLHPKAPRSLHENAAVSIGRIGLMHPGMVAPLLPDFAQEWCQALYEIRDNEEKDSAFRGLCTLVQTNPAGIAKVSSRLIFVSVLCNLSSLSPRVAETRMLIFLPPFPPRVYAFLEFTLVLQCDCEVEPSFCGAEHDVPTTFEWVQTTRCSGLASPSLDFPSRHTRAIETPVWGIERTMVVWVVMFQHHLLSLFRLVVFHSPRCMTPPVHPGPFELINTNHKLYHVSFFLIQFVFVNLSFCVPLPP